MIKQAEILQKCSLFIVNIVGMYKAPLTHISFKQSSFLLVNAVNSHGIYTFQLQFTVAYKNTDLARYFWIEQRCVCLMSLLSVCVCVSSVCT